MNRPASIQPGGGFTLVEVLVSVLVFGILAAGAYVALDGLAGAAGHHRESAGRFADIQRAVARLDADLRQLVTRPSTGPEGTLRPALAGETAGLTATRAGWINPAGQRRGELQRFGWSMDAGTLVRSAWPVTDPVAATPGTREAVLGRVETFDLRYRDRLGNWHPTWPHDGTPGSLPAAVEYRLELADRGEIRRLVVVD